MDCGIQNKNELLKGTQKEKCYKEYDFEREKCT